MNKQEAMEKVFSEWAEHFRSVIKSSLGIELAYDEASVHMLDDLIDRIFLPEELDENNPVFWDKHRVLSAYLGEIIRISCNGHWYEAAEDEWGVRIGDVTAMPFVKMRKRLLNGQEDSLAYYYKMLVKGLSTDFSFVAKK